MKGGEGGREEEEGRKSGAMQGTLSPFVGIDLSVVSARRCLVTQFARRSVSQTIVNYHVSHHCHWPPGLLRVAAIAAFPHGLALACALWVSVLPLSGFVACLG